MGVGCKGLGVMKMFKNRATVLAVQLQTCYESWFVCLFFFRDKKTILLFKAYMHVNIF